MWSSEPLPTQHPFFSARREHFLLLSWQQWRPITDRCPELRAQTFLLSRDLMRLFPGPDLPTDQQTFNYCLSPARPLVKKMPLVFRHHSRGCTDGPLRFINRLRRGARGLSVFPTTSWGGRPKTPVRRKGSPHATHTVQCGLFISFHCDTISNAAVANEPNHM